MSYIADVDDSLQIRDSIRIGWAISLKSGGLVAAAIHDCAMLTLDQIMAVLRDLTLRARGEKPKSSVMSDPTIPVWRGVQRYSNCQLAGESRVRVAIVPRGDSVICASCHKIVPMPSRIVSFLTGCWDVLTMPDAHIKAPSNWCTAR